MNQKLFNIISALRTALHNNDTDILEEVNNYVIFDQISNNILEIRFDGFIYDLLNDYDSEMFERFEKAINDLHLSYERYSASIIHIYL